MPDDEDVEPGYSPGITNRRVAEVMGDYRHIEPETEGVNPALDDLAEAVCGVGGHIPPRDRSLSPCDFHRRMAAGYLRVVEAADV